MGAFGSGKGVPAAGTSSRGPEAVGALARAVGAPPGPLPRAYSAVHNVVVAGRGRMATAVRCLLLSACFLALFLAGSEFSHLMRARHLGAAAALSGAEPKAKAPAAPDHHRQEEEGPRVAVCLVGGARAFELTGVSIRAHLLSAYPHTDVFVNVPLDKDSHKLSLLAGGGGAARPPNIAALRIFAQEPIAESGPARAVLTGDGSPQGIQGLLQYFDLVEGCLPLIRRHESRRNFTYAWIVRTRVDGFWSAPPPPFSSLDSYAYTVPIGSNFGGFNDRFGLGGPASSEAALRRLSLLYLLREKGVAGANSEKAFRGQLQARGVPVASEMLPFCVLSQRRYAFSVESEWAVPVASIASRAPLSGAKCRPCTPQVTGLAASVALGVLRRDWGWIGDHPAGAVDLCNAAGPWEAGWEHLFDRAAGPAAAAARKAIGSRSYDQCVAENRALQGAAGEYTGPSAAVLCHLAALGDATRAGADQWPVFLSGLGPGSAVLSAGAGRDVSFESEVAERARAAAVHVLDGTPHGAVWVRAAHPLLSPRVALHGWCLAPADGELAVHPLAYGRNEPGVWTSLTEPPANYSFMGPPVLVPARTLASTMQHLKLAAPLDLLKVGVSGTEFELVEAWAREGAGRPLPVCQLLISFGEKWAGERGRLLGARARDRLRALGMTLVKCTGAHGAPHCVYLSETACKLKS